MKITIRKKESASLILARTTAETSQRAPAEIQKDAIMGDISTL